MATLKNQNGTDAADELTYYQGGTAVYHAGLGNDKISIIGGATVTVILDGGSNTINISKGSGHVIKVAAVEADGNKIVGADKLTINGANTITAMLGSGKDIIDISNSNGKTVNGLSQLRGGEWGDTFKVFQGVLNYQLYGENGDDVFEIIAGTNLNFWGGSGRDTFELNGGSNNKTYGGDSEDTFNIRASKQTVTLGYGGSISQQLFDTVNVYAGDNQTIYGNLGINQINLLAGTGHVIKADIDRTLSKKNGYTDEQINAGIGLGYGVDNILIDGAEGVTANTGDGKDVVLIKNGSNHVIHTEGWGDTIEISGAVSNSLFDGGEGSDSYIIDWKTLGTGNTIDQRTAGVNDKDLVKLNEKLDKFTVEVRSDCLTLTDKDNGKALEIIGWGNGINSIEFSDGVKTESQMLERGGGDDVVEVRKDGEKIYTADGSDIIRIYSKNNNVNAGVGNDIIDIYKGSTGNTVWAGSGMDTFIINGSSNIIYGEAGDDIVQIGYEGEGTNAADANPSNNNVNMGEGDNIVTIYGGQKNTIVCGSGMDSVDVYGGSGHKIDTGAGDDEIVIYGGTEVTLKGGAGDDLFDFWEIAANGVYSVDQSTALADDMDILSLENYNSADFVSSKTNATTMKLTHKTNNAVITITGYSANNLEILFSDKAIGNAALQAAAMVFSPAGGLETVSLGEENEAANKGLMVASGIGK